MKKYWKKIISLILSAAVLCTFFTGCTQGEAADDNVQNSETEYETEYEQTEADEGDIVYYGEDYSTPLEVAAYIYEWEELPPNYITKNEAEKLGWQSNKGNLWYVAYGKSIGGDRFGNREGLLPEGEEYRECDVNYEGGYRGGERIVYSIDDYDIYYTDDHYESFSQMYSYEEGYIWEE